MGRVLDPAALESARKHSINTLFICRQWGQAAPQGRGGSLLEGYLRACFATLFMWDRQVVQSSAGLLFLEPETCWIGLLPPS